MSAFNKQEFAQQIEALTIDEVQNRIADIDERCYDDLHKREVLVERRTFLFDNESPDGKEIVGRDWTFIKKIVKKPVFGDVVKYDRDVASLICKRYVHTLSISAKDLESILKTEGWDKDRIAEFIQKVSNKATPTIQAKRK